MRLLLLFIVLMSPSLWADDTAEAIFAGGCFWCMEPPYDEIDGVKETISGYIGGTTDNPTYKQVVAGDTGHTEAVKIVYDPSRVDYQTLLEIFWRNIDPLDAGGQFCDRGDSYRAGIFYLNDEQEALARASKTEVEARFDEPVVTEITEASEFYEAEHYHQNYYQKNPVRYKYYRYRCGRDARLDALWK